MRSRLSQPACSPDEYLAFERLSDGRHEFLDGYIYAMAGESIEHSTICFNLATIVGTELRGKPCRGLSPNMKIRTSPTGLYSYSDLTVVCGEPLFHDRQRDVLVNPIVIIEVLSPSTEAYDRGEKWVRYQQIESLSDYLLIAQDRPLIEHYLRQPDGRWLYSATADRAGSVSLVSIDCRLRLADVYDRISFPTTPPEDGADESQQDSRRCGN